MYGKLKEHLQEELDNNELDQDDLDELLGNSKDDLSDIDEEISDNDDNELAQDDLDELLGITNDEISDIEEKTENEARNLFRTNERLVRLGLEKVENLDDLPDELEDVDPFLEEAANITYDVLSVGKYAINSDKN